MFLSVYLTPDQLAQSPKPSNKGLWPLAVLPKFSSVPCCISYVDCLLSSPSRVKETLDPGVLRNMQASAKEDYPVLDPKELPLFDAYLFGVPTRYGNFPAQWKVGIFH